MATKLVTIRITHLVVTSNGDFPGENPSHDAELGLKNNSLLASLTYPRSGASQVLSAKQYDLANSVPAQLLDPDTPDNFFDTLLFREDVDDQTMLHLKVTNFDGSGKGTKFFFKLFSVVLGAGVGVASGGLSTVIGAIVGFGVDQIKTGINSAGDAHIDTIGQAQLPISVVEYSTVPVVKVLQLIAPQTIQRSGFVGQPPAEHTMDVTTKGKSNGSITLEITAVQRGEVYELAAAAQVTG